MGLSYLSWGVTAEEQGVNTKVENTCSGTYPSYWQDVQPKFSEMWAGQTVSNAPSVAWTDPVFQLSDRYPRQPVDDARHQKWRDKKFDALFKSNTSQATKKALADEYAWLVFEYVLAGNINQPEQLDFGVCRNPVRPWYHIPFQTYDAMSGREFTHGLTREAPVTFSVNNGAGTDSSTMWAVGIYNATAAYTLGTMWSASGEAKIPTSDISFDEGAVIAKPLFNTSTVEQLPVLANMPSWNANISDPAYCNCTSAKGKNHECTLGAESKQCKRSYAKWQEVKLLQFDIAIKDSRAEGTKWVYGTFVADGQEKATEKEPWKRVSLLGLMWGNDTPPEGQLAYSYPVNPRQNGFEDAVIDWETVDGLNRVSGEGVMRQLGHLGCNQRLNGPADNANSSCMSCHGTASVPDQYLVTPPMISQFSSATDYSAKQTQECVAPILKNPMIGMDRAGDTAAVSNDVSFAALDSLYFANVEAGVPFNTMAKTAKGEVNIMGEGVPAYSSGRKEWISLDYSLQSSIALKQWMQWQNNQPIEAKKRIVDKELRRNR